MMDTDHQTKIDELNENIEKFTDQLGTEKDAFISASKSFLKNWFHNYSEKIAKDNPELTISLGEKGTLSDLKKAIKDLEDSSDELIEEHVNKDDLWFHKNKNTASGNSYVSVKSTVLDGLMNAMWELGPVFQEYGYVQPGSKDDWKHLGLKKSPTTGVSASRRFFDNNNLNDELPAELERPLSNFQSSILKIKRAKDTIIKLEKEMEKKRANDLWDQA